MLVPSLPENEKERLAALKQLNLLDSPPEEAFDDFTFLASNICGAPISIITLLDETRQWFKSKVGIDATETPREISFCGHALLQDDIFEVGDALSDERFMGNPLVIGEPKIRFYAGIPIKSKEGFNLGTLCVIDRVPKKLTDTQRNALKSLSRQVTAQIELQRTLITNQKLIQNRMEQAVLMQKITDHVPALISYWDKNLICQFASEGYHRYFGKPVHTLIGKHYNDVIGDHYYQIVAPKLKNALNGERQMFDMAGRNLDGSTRHGIVHYIPDFDRKGNVQGIHTFVHDVTDFKVSEEKRLLAELANESANIGIVITNKNHEIRSVNQTFLKIMGYTEFELIGKTPEFLFDSHSIHEVMECLSSNKDWTGEVKYRRKNGELVEHQGTVSVLKNQNGEVTHHVATIRDLTEKIKLQNELVNTQKMLERTGKIANVGGWEYDFHGKTIRWTEQVYLIHELESREIPTIEFALSFYPAEARAKLQDAIQTCIDLGVSWDLELPFITAKGNHIWVRAMGEMIRENGKKTKLVGIFQDISSRKEQEQLTLNKEIALRQAVVREVHHHIKNNIQGLSGILYNAAARQPALSEPIHELVSQLEGVAVIHGLQGRSLESDIEIAELTLAISQNIRRIWQTEITAYIQEDWATCHLSKSEAVPIALILNELITNAVKHHNGQESVRLNLTQSVRQSGGLEVKVDVINHSKFEFSKCTDSQTEKHGLKLIQDLMPRHGAYFSMSSRDNLTSTQLSLSVPIIYKS